MDLKWLQDFVTLAELKSFTRAADERFVTQPAFSRRIKALEAWVGTPLVDRRTTPVTLTLAGEQFLPVAAGVVRDMNQIRADLAFGATEHESVLVWTMPGSLAVTFFPTWWQQFVPLFPEIHARIRDERFLDSVHALDRGLAHLMLWFWHPAYPLAVDSTRFLSLEVGVERLVPVSAPAGTGGVRHSLSDGAATCLPIVRWEANTLLNRVTSEIIRRAGTRIRFDTVWESPHHTEIRSSLLAGQGIGWVPERLVQRELSAGSLVRAGDDEWTERLKIMLFRPAEDRHWVVPPLWQRLQNEPTPSQEEPRR